MSDNNNLKVQLESSDPCVWVILQFHWNAGSVMVWGCVLTHDVRSLGNKMYSGKTPFPH